MRPEHREHLLAPPTGKTMTIGELSMRTGESVKQLRRYEDLGFIYTVGRSAGNYRLFDESALWCVDVAAVHRPRLTLPPVGDLRVRLEVIIMAPVGTGHVTSSRAIGAGGTAARLLVGGYMVTSVAYGSLAGDGTFQPGSWLIGLVGLPTLLLGWQAWRARRSPRRLVAFTGPVGHLVTLVFFLVLYTTSWYAPPVGFLSDAALLFFGSSMLLAAARGHAGCEVLSISNWLLGRNDQVGCVLFDSLDQFERRRAG